jgi:hypothetical protein
MSLKEFCKCIENQNKLNDFMSDNLEYKEIKVIKIDCYSFREKDFKTSKEIVKAINEEYYSNINENIELINNDGYVQFTFEQSIPNYTSGKLEYIKENKTITLYLKNMQIWN